MVQTGLSYPKRLVNQWQLRNFFRTLPVNSSLYFDVGANRGDRTAFFVGLGKRVVAIEPQPVCLQTLKQRFSDNPNVMIEPAGIGSTRGMGYLYVSSRYNAISSMDKNWQKGTKYGQFDQRVKIRLTTLESLIKKHGLPDFCKIDVEGYELPVLEGLKTKIPCLNFEFHGNRLKEAGQCLERLKRLGYTRFNYGESENPPKLDDWVDAAVLQQFLAVRAKEVKKFWGDIYAK